VIADLLPIGAAIRVLGWRAAAPSVGDSLETCEVYSHIRHPIYCGLLLEFAGILLLIFPVIFSQFP